MKHANEAECEAAGIDTKKVESLARRFAALAKESHALGVYVFGGSGSGTIRPIRHNERPLILASITSSGFDGGDGATRTDEDGLLHGE
jgi:hypothetical protein